MAMQARVVIAGAVLLAAGLIVGGGVGSLRGVNKTASSGCSKSLTESDGFYCMPDAEWNERVAVVSRRAGKQCGKDQICCREGPSRTLEEWYEDCFEPEWSCLIERIGRPGDGGKWLCDIDTVLESARKKKEPCLVYSAGSNGDYSFEMSVHERMPDCEIFTFDPTVDLVARPPPDFVNFKKWGLGPNDGVDAADVLGTRAVEGGKMYRLRTAMKMLGHENREVDIFKIDIEGHEYSVFNDFFADDYLPFRQIQIEIHNPRKNPKLHMQLRHHGYVITHKEPNYNFFLKLQEYAFLRLERNFFKDIVPDPHVIPIIENAVKGA